MATLTLFRRMNALRAGLAPLGVSLVMLALTIGCGDGEAPANEPQLVLEVEAPATEQGATITILDYQIACDPAWDTLDEAGVFVPAARRVGTMELTGPASPTSGDELVDRALWSATEAPLSGLCLLNLIGRDEQRRSLCAGTATFQATGAPSDRVSAVMECLERPAFIGDLFVAADTPLAVGEFEVQTVEFTIGCEARGTAFFEGMTDSKAAVTLSGNLEVLDEPDRMSVQQSFLDLPTGSCTIQLRARDDDGEVRCTGDESFIVAPAQTTHVDMVVGCS